MKLLVSAAVVGIIVVGTIFFFTNFVSADAPKTDPPTAANGGDAPACKDFTQVTEELWANDLDRLAPDEVKVNFQAQLPDKGNIQDKSPKKLFTYVDESRLNSPVYATFLPLLDNYNPEKNKKENVTKHKLSEDEEFLDAILATPIFKTLVDFLLCEGKVKDMGDMKATLRRLWFDLYPRSGKSTVLDTSGFEHVMVGEYKSPGLVNGMHNWLAFYEKEKTGDIDYYGHTCDVHPNTMCAAFDWDGHKKRLASFFLRTSPAYDMAIYSLCYLVRPGTCHVMVDGKPMDIQTYSKERHVATAFIVTK